MAKVQELARVLMTIRLLQIVRGIMAFTWIVAIAFDAIVLAQVSMLIVFLTMLLSYLRIENYYAFLEEVIDYEPGDKKNERTGNEEVRGSSESSNDSSGEG